LKKCLLAELIGSIVPAGYERPGALTLFAARHVALPYSLQLYFDFSNYSDMAIGVARMFNLRFPLNFNSPYQAASVDRILAVLAHDADPVPDGVS
jgi:alginate O-acetyltransferase complex protein AlgI